MHWSTVVPCGIKTDDQPCVAKDIFDRNGLVGVAASRCHPDWAILAMQQDPRIEHSREVLFQADVLVATQIYGIGATEAQALKCLMNKLTDVVQL